MSLAHMSGCLTQADYIDAIEVAPTPQLSTERTVVVRISTNAVSTEVFGP